MSSSNETLERIARRIPILEPAYERLLRRRDRKRRNQRIASGVVGIAVFVAGLLIVTSVGPLNRSETRVVPGGAGTGPTVTPTAAPEPGWDGVGIPPEGTIASAPETGDLIGHHGEYYGDVYVYADGRVIWSAGGPPSRRIYERRLTAEGVDLVRSGVIEPAVTKTDDQFHRSVLDGVPATAWADAEAELYVPSRYAFCFWPMSGDSNSGTVNGGYEYPSTVLPFFPPAARAILRGEVSNGPECSAVTTDEARTLDEMLTDVRVEDAEGDPIGWEVAPILPHGAPLLCLGCY